MAQTLDHEPAEKNGGGGGVAVEQLAPRLLRVQDAARLLGIGRTTAYELISTGDLEVVHIGRSTRVPLDAIDAFVDELRKGLRETTGERNAPGRVAPPARRARERSVGQA